MWVASKSVCQPECVHGCLDIVALEQRDLCLVVVIQHQATHVAVGGLEGLASVGHPHHWVVCGDVDDVEYDEYVGDLE